MERRLTAAVRHDPDSFEAQHALGELYLHQGKMTEAIPHLERAHAITPTDYTNGYDLALAYLQTDRLDEARQLARRLLATKKTAELHNLLGNVEERAGNLVDAAEAYQRAAHLDATEPHLFDWGNNLLQLGALEPATEVFTAAVERHPDAARLHVGLGIALYSTGEYDEAVRVLCHAADLDPSDPRPYEFLGEMYGVAPALADEITPRLARFVRTHPRNALANFYYALNLWQGDAAGTDAVDLAEVERRLRRATELDPTLAKGFLQLGILLSEQDRYPEAVRELRTAVTLAPDLPQAHFRLARAYQRTGEADLAAKELKIFQRLKEQSAGTDNNR